MLLAAGWKTDFAIRDWSHESDSIRVILIGDTGQLPVEGNPHKMSPLQRDLLRQSLESEKATAILDLGDLFYLSGPKCRPKASPEDSGKVLDAHLYDHVGGLNTPVFLVLGNHDVGPIGEHLKKMIFGPSSGRRHAARERCYRLQDSLHEEIIFPSASYGVDLGPARMAVLHTSAPQKHWADEEIADFLEQDPNDWTLVAGHHVLRTGCDKTTEDVVEPWLDEHGLKPDLYANGHAHILQMGVFDEIPAVTSGSGSKMREFPGCDPTDTEGVLWGRSAYGYAVLDVDRESMQVQFKDIEGNELYCWKRDRLDPRGKTCPILE
jgi:3',5'-cyclic AMP phosphodiesterase CpdA